MDTTRIKEMHPRGLRGIFYVYDWKRLMQSQPFKCALGLILLLSVALLFVNGNYFLHVQAVVDLGLSIFPSLLGFTIGGYALIVGFASSANLKKFTRPAKDSKGSFYQALMSIFSVAILLQTLSIVCCYVVSYIIKSKFQIETLELNATATAIVNYCVVIIIGFLSLWSLFTVPFVATNLFNFAQTNHLLGTIERIQEEEKEEITDTSNNGDVAAPRSS